MNILWDIRISLGLVPKESPCTFFEDDCIVYCPYRSFISPVYRRLVLIFIDVRKLKEIEI
jgi:hypothetical protein